MGMTCTLHRIAADGIDELAKDPEKVREILFSDDENWTMTRPRGLLGFLLRFTPISIETAIRKEPVTAEEIDRLREVECDLEGGWHGLHFLFTGTAWEGDEPACYLIRGGEEVHDYDSDLPPRVLRPQLVRDFNRYLADLSVDELRGRYDPGRMRELSIDPASLWKSPAQTADPGLDLLLESFDRLKVFVNKVAVAGDGVIIHLA